MTKFSRSPVLEEAFREPRKAAGDRWPAGRPVPASRRRARFAVPPTIGAARRNSASPTKVCPRNCKPAAPGAELEPDRRGLVQLRCCPAWRNRTLWGRDWCVLHNNSPQSRVLGPGRRTRYRNSSTQSRCPMRYRPRCPESTQAEIPPRLPRSRPMLPQSKLCAETGSDCVAVSSARWAGNVANQGVLSHILRPGPSTINDRSAKIRSVLKQY